MKKIIILAILIIFCIPKCYAVKSVKTYTPFPSNRNYYNNNYNKYLPPPPPPPSNSVNRWYNPNWNNNYYNYNSPYYGYYPQKNSFFSSIGNFFSRGKMTGYTPSYNSAFDNVPYGYQNGYQNSNGDYYIDNYDIQNSSTIKLLD